jgi:hypothetical protein
LVTATGGTIVTSGNCMVVKFIVLQVMVGGFVVVEQVEPGQQILVEEVVVEDITILQEEAALAAQESLL